MSECAVSLYVLQFLESLAEMFNPRNYGMCAGRLGIPECDSDAIARPSKQINATAEYTQTVLHAFPAMLAGVMRSISPTVAPHLTDALVCSETSQDTSHCCKAHRRI